MYGRAGSRGRTCQYALSQVAIIVHRAPQVGGGCHFQVGVHSKRTHLPRRERPSSLGLYLSVWEDNFSISEEKPTRDHVRGDPEGQRPAEGWFPIQPSSAEICSRGWAYSENGREVLLTSWYRAEQSVRRTVRAVILECRGRSLDHLRLRVQHTLGVSITATPRSRLYLALTAAAQRYGSVPDLESEHSVSSDSSGHGQTGSSAVPMNGAPPVYGSRRPCSDRTDRPPGACCPRVGAHAKN